MYVKGESIADTFIQLRSILLESPVVKVRNLTTKEILPVQIEITNPRARLFYHPKRTYNLAFNIAEFLGYIWGINSVDYIRYFNKNAIQFSDNGKDFYGAYGPRICKYLSDVIDKLSKDQCSRQVVITIYDSKDMLANTKDVPCTIALQFTIRNNKLILHTMMRSNDLIWGFQYDMFAFSLLQEIIANSLGIDIGSYFHTATSFHVYDYHWKLLEEMDSVESIEMPNLNLDLYEAQNTAIAVREAVFNKSFNFENFPYNDLALVIKAFALKKIGYKEYKVILPVWAKKLM